MSILLNKSFVFLCFILNLVVGGTPELRINKLTLEQRKNLDKICGGFDVKPSAGTSSQEFKVFGNKAIPKQFPWTVHLRFYGADDEVYECSGVLITQQHLLTSAHCFFPPAGFHPTLIDRNPIVFVARVIMDDAPNTDSEYYIPNDIDKTYKVIGFIFHPCYKINQPINNDQDVEPSHLAYDIVIGQLDRPLDQNRIDEQLALPACLPDLREVNLGTDISFSGYGESGSLQWTTMERVACDSKAAQFPFLQCYKPTGWLNYIEHGDSGGGLVQKGVSGRWNVIGILHGHTDWWPTWLGSRAKTFLPVSHSVDWIEKEVGIQL